MSHVTVQLKLDNAGATLVTTPSVVVVAPKDTIEWKCDDGEVTVSFEGKAVFEGNGKFHGKKGHATAQGKVRADVARGQHFNCVVTFNGKPMPITYGVDTSGVGD